MSKPDHGFLRATLLAVLCTAAGERSLAAASLGGTEGEDSRLHALVERRAGGPKDEAELVQAFAKLGTSIAPDLFELQLSEGFEAFLPADFDPSAWVVPPDDLPRVALRALVLLPDEVVLAHVRSRLSGARDLELVLAAARTIGAAAAAEGLPMLLEIVDGLGTDLGFPHARATVATALREVLVDPACAGALARKWKLLEPRTRDLVVEAMLALERPAVAEFLLSQLGADPALDLRILPKVAAPFERAPWKIEALDLAGLERSLESNEPRVRALAATVLGKLQREEALDRLLEHLTDADPRVERAVTAVLHTWSGNAVSAFSDWSVWAAEEQRWHQDAMPAILSAIDPESPPETVMAAVYALAQRPVHRRDAVRELAAILPRTCGEFARQIARTLERLDGREAVPQLIDALSTPDDGLQLEVWKTLRKLTDADLGPDPDDWRAWLEG